MSDHPAKDKLEAILPSIREFQKLATQYGIADVFQDNGGKIFQVLVKLNLTIVPGREGNDAKDELGNEYELKSLNIDLTEAFSTHHHMNPTIITKYRKVPWIFAVYKSIELQSLYLLSPIQMEPYFVFWENKWNTNGNKDLNNPKVPLKHVKDHGIILYDINTPQEVRPSLHEASIKLKNQLALPALTSTRKPSKKK
jgi:hypothetical protein